VPSHFKNRMCKPNSDVELAGIEEIIAFALRSIFFLKTLKSGYLLACTKLPNMFFQSVSLV